MKFYNAFCRANTCSILKILSNLYEDTDLASLKQMVSSFKRCTFMARQHLISIRFAVNKRISRACVIQSQHLWTVPQLSIMIIYTGKWSILIQKNRVMWNWPSKYKRKRTSSLWSTYSHERNKWTERGRDWNFAELHITSFDMIFCKRWYQEWTSVKTIPHAT